MAFSRVHKGDRFNIGADAVNEMFDAVEANRKRAAAEKQGPGPQPSTPYQQRVVQIANETGRYLNEYSVVGVDVPQSVFASDDANVLEKIVLRGAIPDASKHKGRFAITLKPCDTDGVVPAVFSGVAMALIEPGAIPNCRRADIVDGKTGYLALSAHGSVDVLWLGPEPPVTSGAPGHQEEARHRHAFVRLGSEPVIFPVVMQKTSGVQGSASTQAQYSYTVKDLFGLVLASDIDPTVAPHRCSRQTFGYVDPAQVGLASYIDGTLVILMVNEIWSLDRSLLVYQDQLEITRFGLQSQIDDINHRLQLHGI